MQPLYLHFKGLASYKEEQHIDFSELSNAGLFGIFGDTGAGKSTLLEAISIALYGKALRGSQKSIKHLINRHSDELTIEFIFRGFDKHIYAFTYRLGVQARKRKNKTGASFQEDDYKKDSEGTNYYRYHGMEARGRALWESFKQGKQEWQVLNPNKGEEQAALKHIPIEHFTQTIILPQGKFDEFIKKQPAERSGFLRELFNLNEYEIIKKKTSEKCSKAEEEVKNIKNRLKEYETISEEELQKKKSEEEQLLKQLNAKKEEINKLARQVEQIHAAKEKENQIKNLRRQLSEIESNLEQLPADLEAQQQRLKIAQNLFERPLNSLKEKNEVLKTKAEIAGQLQKRTEQRQQQIQKSREEYQKLSMRHEELCRKKENIRHLEDYIKQYQELQEVKKSLAEQTKELEMLRQEHKCIKETLEKLSEIIDEKEASLKQLESEKLHDINQHLKSLEKHSEKYYLQRSQCEKFYKPLETILKQINIDNQDLPALLKEVVKEDRIEHLKKVLQDLLVNTSLEVELRSWRQKLKAGEPCPLCGSTEHTLENLAIDSVPHEELQRQTSLLEEALQTLEGMQKAWSHFQHLKTLFISEINAYNQSKGDEFPLLPKEEVLRQESFFKQALSNIKQQLHQKKTKMLDDEEAIRQLNAKKEKIKEELQQKEVQIARLEERAKQQNETARQLQEKIEAHETQHPEYQNKIIEELKSLVQDIHRLHEETEAALKQAEQKLEQMEKEQHAEEVKLKTLQEDIAALQKEINGLEEDIRQLLQTYTGLFDKVEDVQQVLKEKEHIRENISKKERLLSSQTTLQKQLHKIQEERQQLHIPQSSEEQAHICQQHEEKQAEISRLQEEKGRLFSEIRRLEDALNKKSKLLQTYEQNKKSLETWERINKLTEGNGFLNFVLGDYLHTVNQLANKYFEKLTNQTLSFEITTERDKIEIQVIDRLNQYKRPPESLSGGQNFILSLSLSLALSEYLQTTHNIKQHFFFIDEGFGSLDEKTLFEVMNVLEQLACEGKVIGVISHVQSMRERIRTALIATHNAHKGSYIQLAGTDFAS